MTRTSTRTPEEKRLAKNAYNKAYRSSEKGKRKVRDYYENHKDDYAANQKRYRSTDKGKAAIKDYYESHKVDYHKRRRGTRGDVPEKEPHSLCNICEKLLVGDYAQKWDHDHKTGQYRGILCHGCNTKLSQSREAKLLTQAADAATTWEAKALLYLVAKHC